MNQCIKVVTITWSILTAAVCSPLPQNVETIPSIASTVVVSSTIDPDTIYLTTSFPQLPGQTVAIFRDAREVNSPDSHEDIKHGTALPETASEENSTQNDKSRSQRNLAKTENDGHNETQSTLEHSGEAEPDVKKSPIKSHDHSTDIYGKTTAEELADLSVIDVLLRKRRALSSIHQKQERSLPETTDSDEVLTEEEEESNEDISQEKRKLGSESSNAGRKDGNSNQGVKLTEHDFITHVTSVSSSSSSSDRDTQNGTLVHKPHEDNKSDINNEDTVITGKSNGSFVSNAHQGDESTNRLNKSVYPVTSVLDQLETDKGQSPSFKSDSVDPNASKLQTDEKVKPSQKHGDSVVHSIQKTENESDTLKTHETESKQESHIKNLEKIEKLDTTNQNEKHLDNSSNNLFINVTLHGKQDKSRTSLKRNAELKQETETDLTSSTESDIITNEDEKPVDKVNHHFFANITRHTIKEKNEPLLKNNGKSEEDTQTEASFQKHEFHLVDEGVKLINENTQGIFSNVSGNKQESKSVNVSQENKSLGTSSMNVHQPHSLEITEGTAQVSTNLNATHDQELSGRNLALEIMEGTSHVSTNQEILHTLQKRSDDHSENSNPSVVTNPHFTSNFHLSANPHDDDKPHDVISVHKESRFSENRQNEEDCSDDSPCKVRRSDEESNNSRSSEEIDSNHVKNAGSESLVSPIPFGPYNSHLRDTLHLALGQHISSNLSVPLPLRIQVQTTSSSIGETKVDNGKTHHDKRSSDDTTTDDISKAEKRDSSVQTDNVPSAENHRNVAHGTPKYYEVLTNNETTIPKSHEYSQNPSKIISISLHNENSSHGIVHSSVTEHSQPPFNETSSQNGDKIVNRSNYEGYEIYTNKQNVTHIVSTKGGSQDIQKSNNTNNTDKDTGNGDNGDKEGRNTDEQITLTSVESVSMEHHEENATIVTEKQDALSSTTIQQETSTAEKSEGILDGFKGIAKFIGF